MMTEEEFGSLEYHQMESDILIDVRNGFGNSPDFAEDVKEIQRVLDNRLHYKENKHLLEKQTPTPITRL